MKTKFETVADIPDDYILVTDSQEVEHTLAMVGVPKAKVSLSVYGALFVKIGDGEILDCQAIVGNVPYLGKPVFSMMAR